MYDVMYRSAVIGRVSVTRKGLYSQFFSKCQFPDKEIHRLSFYQGQHRLDLGVFVPDGNGFVLSKRLPLRQIKDGAWRFVVEEGRTVRNQPLLAVAEDKPFPQLSFLQLARLVREGQQMGIVLTNPAADPQGNDLSP